MFQPTFRLGRAWAKLEQIPAVAARIFRERLGTEISPALQEDVRAIMAESEGEPVSPFAFATARSARFYFWLVTSSVFSAASDGTHWIRSGELEEAWQVQVQYGTFNATIRIVNPLPWAKYVYGPARQVPGHFQTGWGSQYARAQRLILQQAKRATIQVWHASVRQAVRELGLTR